MSKNGLIRLANAAAVAALLLPYRYEKTEDGFTVSSVLVKVQYKNALTPAERAEAPEGSTGKTVISVPGILDEQIETVKTLWAKGTAYAAEKREEMLARAVRRQENAADEPADAEESDEFSPVDDASDAADAD